MNLKNCFKKLVKTDTSKQVKQNEDQDQQLLDEITDFVTNKPRNTRVPFQGNTYWVHWNSCTDVWEIWKHKNIEEYNSIKIIGGLEKRSGLIQPFFLYLKTKKKQ
jgi:hypothetical protein